MRNEKLTKNNLNTFFIRGLLVICMTLFYSCFSYKRVIDDPVYISDGRAISNCVKEFEAVPSAVTNSQGDINLFVGFDMDRMTYSKGTWADWSAGPSGSVWPGYIVPINRNDLLRINSITGDAWTTYSAAKNLAYFYYIGRYQNAEGNTTSCVAVAATSPEKFEAQEWEYPAVCLSELNGDQGAILQIDATNTFYAATKVGPDLVIQAFDNCQGAPGPTYGCPRTAITTLTGIENALQMSLSENPCTGNLILAYRKDKAIRLRFFDQNLNTISEYVVRTNQPFQPGQTNKDCTIGTIHRCGMGTTDCCGSGDCDTQPLGTCLRVNGRPSVDTYQKTVNGNKVCGAVIAYDALVKGSDGNDWSKSRLDIVDITNENNPVIISQWNSTNSEYTWNQYLSHAVVSDNGPNSSSPKIAWFWLTDIRGACQVIAEGATTENLGTSMQATGIISGPFPAASMSSYGIGDYFSGVKGGGKDGALYVSWGEPVKSSSTSTACVTCKGDVLNLATKITRIRWERKIKPKRPRISNSSQGPFPLKQL